MLLVTLLLSLAACASQPLEPAYFVFTLGDKIPAFFLGLGHGLVAPLALLASLFFKVRIYEWPNHGWWYDCGFVLGILMWAGAGAASQRSA